MAYLFYTHYINITLLPTLTAILFLYMLAIQQIGTLNVFYYSKIGVFPQTCV